MIKIKNQCNFGRSILLCLVTTFSSPIWSDAACDHVQQKLTNIHTMKATFTQVVRTKHHKPLHSTGNMALSRPSKLFWKIEHPMAQAVIADGKRLWIYDVSLEQVTVKPERQGVGGVAGLFLAGSHTNVAQYFNVVEHNNGNIVDYDLRSKSNKANIQKVHLRFVGTKLVLLQLFDQLGQNTEIHFNNIQMNQSLPTGLFNFKPPRGVDVIRQ